MLKQLIDPSTGILKDEDLPEALVCIDLAKKMCLNLLGSTLIVRGKPYILASLELYYGGVGDMGNDWHRYNFQSKKGLSGEDVKWQVTGGPRVYISKHGPRQRMDIVLGPDGVAVSALVRNVIDPEKGSFSDSWIGNTKLIQDRMGISRADLGKPIKPGGEFELIDTHGKYVSSVENDIIHAKRVQAGKHIGFKGTWGEELWNFTLREGVIKY